jgi:hypothetical protein
MMQREEQPVVRIGEFTLVGNYWFQLVPGEEAVVEIPPLPLRLIMTVEDFGAIGLPETKYIPTEDSHTAKLVFRRVKRTGIGGFGTQRAVQLGWMDNVEIWVSYVLRSFQDTVHVTLALYTKPKKEEADASK